MIVPIVVPVRRRADPFPPLSQKLLLIECLLVLGHEVDCSCQLMGKDREGFWLAVLMDKSIEISLWFALSSLINKTTTFFAIICFPVSLSI